MRRHLENLEDAGLIAERELAPGVRGRGRPARAFVLSDAGHQALESDYDHLATEALRFLAAGGRRGRRPPVRRVAASPSSSSGMPQSWLPPAPTPPPGSTPSSVP